MKAPFLTVLALLAGAEWAFAQQRIDETVASAGTGTVEVVNLAGSVRVVGWDRNEIRVTGTLGEGAERLEITGGRDRTEIRVVLPQGRRGRNIEGSDLEVRVPAGKTMAVRTTSADIAVSGISGPLTTRSVSGDVSISGSPREVTAASTSGDVTFAGGSTSRVRVNSTSGDVRVTGSVRESVSAESVSGDVEVSAATPEVRASAVSGDLMLRGVSGRVSASTVSGETEILDSRIQYGSFETVSGNLLFDGELQRGAAFNIQSHSGDVEMRLPGNVSSDFEVQTFSGDIVNRFGPEPRRTSGRGPGQELRFTAGNGGGLVTLKTFSGTVRLVRK